MNSLVFLFAAPLLATTVTMISIPPLSGCDCEPVIVGETASGGNVSKDVIPANGSGLGGTVIAVNDGEVSGLCDTSVNCTSPAPCAFNVSVQVKLIVSSGIPVPTNSALGQIHILSPQWAAQLATTQALLQRSVTI